MAKYLDQIEPQTFKDSPKATHFTQDYVIVCEKDLLVSSLGQGYGIFQTPGGPTSGFNNAFAPWWIQGFETHGGIPTLDPFRAKTRRFWIATRDNTSPDIDTIIKPSKIDTNEQYHENNVSGPTNKGGLPVQMRVASNEDQNKKITWDIEHGAPFKDNSVVKSPETMDNIYGVTMVENIDFKVTRNDDKVNYLYTVQQLNAIACAVAGSFLDPSLSIGNYDVSTGENILQAPYPPSWGNDPFPVNLSKTGMPHWDNNETTLRLLCDSMLSKIFNPSAYKPSDLPHGMHAGGKSFHTSDGKVGDAYDTRGVYRDSTFALPTLVSSQAIEAVDGLSDDFDVSGDGAYFADIDPVYNYVSNVYETGIMDVHHTKLPNIYEYMKQLEVASTVDQPGGLDTNF